MAIGNTTHSERAAHRRLLARSLDFIQTPNPGAITGASDIKAWKEFELDAILQASRASHLDVAQALLSIRQAAALVTKNPSLPGVSDSDRRDSALSTFLKVEDYQRVVSRRIRWFRDRPNRLSPLVRTVIDEMRYDIFKLLGPKPGLEDIEYVLRHARFGPGTVGGLSKTGKVTDVTPFGKLSPDTTIWTTERCFRMWAPRIGGVFRQWLFERKAKVVDACRGTTVPKDALTDRFIAVEPYFNSYIQLGQMAHLYELLERWGVTLEDQTRNQKLAHKASLEENAFPNGWSTLDLSSASDSMNTELVRWLLPEPWFEWYNSTRCDSVVLPGGAVRRLEKFSSMGNGNTFALESMIFSAAVRACRKVVGCKEEWAVYGDDMIVSHRASLLLVEVLSFMGFKLNKTKSFIVGRFKESCGADFLGGHNVRPIYLKEALTRTAIYSLFNKFQSLAPCNSGAFCALLRDMQRDGSIGPALNPSGLADTHFVAPIDVLRRRGQLRWVQDLQNYHCSYVAEATVQMRCSRSRKRRQQERAYLAFLSAGMLSDPHVVRGPLKNISEVRVAKNIFFLARYDLSWH